MGQYTWSTIRLTIPGYPIGWQLDLLDRDRKFKIERSVYKPRYNIRFDITSVRAFFSLSLFLSCPHFEVKR